MAAIASQIHSMPFSEKHRMSVAGHKFVFPKVRYVKFINKTFFCEVDVVVHSQEANVPFVITKCPRIKDNQEGVYDLFSDVNCDRTKEHLVQFGADVVRGRKDEKDETHIFTASSEPQDGNYYCAVVYLTGGVQTPDPYSNPEPILWSQ